MLKRLGKYLILLLITFALTAESVPDWEWLDFGEAYPKAIKQDKHLIINFYSTGCYWCRKMDKDTFADSTVAERLETGFIGAKINIGSNRKVEWQGQTLTEHDLARQFGVRGTPFTAFIDTTGEMVGSAPGFIPPVSFLPMLKYVQGYWYNELTFREFLASEEALKKLQSNP